MSVVSTLVDLASAVSRAGSAPAGCTIGPGGAYVKGVCTLPGSLHVSVAYRSIAPILVVSIGALVVLLVSAVLPKRSRPLLYPSLTVLVGLGALAASVWQWSDLGGRGAAGVSFGGQIFYDRFSALFMILISVSLVLSAVGASSYLHREGLEGVEAYVLMLMSSAGAMLMAASGGLIMLFLGLEIMSIALYVLAAYHRRRAASGEAGLKYFLLGAFSSALFLYGIALVYGATGSTQFQPIATFLANNALANNGVLLAGLSLLIVGLGFKVAAVPFHFWTPDVYQGSPTPFTGFMAAVAKAAGFAGLLRVLDQALISEQVDWRPVIWVLAVLTLVVGSVLAIAQRDLKRMLAYSSISQAGYVLVGVQAASSRGSEAALFYLFTYLFIIIGSFVVVGVLQGEGEAHDDLGVLRGLARRNPWLAGGFLVLLLAQAGVPFTSGFLAKFYVIGAAVAKGQYWLAVIAMLAAAVAAFFYLRVALLMYSGARGGAGRGEAGREAELPQLVTPSGAALASETELEPVTLAGLEPVASLDGRDRPDVLEAPPVEAIAVPVSAGAVLGLCCAFTVAAGVSSFAVSFAHAAMALL